MCWLCSISKRCVRACVCVRGHQHQWYETNPLQTLLSSESTLHSFYDGVHLEASRLRQQYTAHSAEWAAPKMKAKCQLCFTLSSEECWQRAACFTQCTPTVRTLASCNGCGRAVSIQRCWTLNPPTEGLNTRLTILCNAMIIILNTLPVQLAVQLPGHWDFSPAFLLFFALRN